MRYITQLSRNYGEKEIIEYELYYIKGVGSRFFSPHIYFKKMGMKLKNPKDMYIKLYHDWDTFKLKTGNEITVYYHPRTNFPLLSIEIPNSKNFYHVL